MLKLKKILVAGLAVVGTVAAVNAQVTSPDTVVNGNNDLTISYEVILLAELNVTPFTLSPSALLTHDPATLTVGTLGQIVVKCTYDKWDVRLAFANGGFLTLEGTGTPSGPDGLGGTTPPIAGDRLKVSGTPKRLLVYGNLSGATAPVNLAADDVSTIYPAISLAKVASTTGFGAGSSALINGEVDGRAVGVIATDGFASTGEGTTRQFFVNAGLHLAGAQDDVWDYGADGVPGGTGVDEDTLVTPASAAETVAGNKPGVYSETVTVTLLAAY